jgi:hypothetical protein
VLEGGTLWRSWFRHCDVAIGPLGFFLDFRPHYGPGVDLASNKNEYREYLPGVKGGRCLGLTTLSSSCAV